MKNKSKKQQHVVSFRGTNVIGEMLYDPNAKDSQFAVYADGKLELTKKYKELVPYSGTHTLIATKTVLLPSHAQKYKNDAKLITNIRSFIHRYVDVSKTFELITAHYVLLTWLFDAFNEVPYLRVRGDFGCGKTRFLQTVGVLTYKGMWATGAASTASLYHMLSDIGGTLIIDESDFSHSSERAQIVKILNNGNAKGFPVLRCEQSPDKKFHPTAYQIYGPKIVASRGKFQDDALESRFFTEDIGLTPVRDDIPLTLPQQFQEEALALRNQLLMFRFTHLLSVGNRRKSIDVCNGLSLRAKQLIAPILTFMSEDECTEVIEWISSEQAQLNRDRGMDMAAHVLTAIYSLFQKHSSVGISDIRKYMLSNYREYYDTAITPKAIGGVVRTKLHLRTHRKNGYYAIPHSEKTSVDILVKRYGLFNS